MIRGLLGVVPHHAVEVGRFYLSIGYQDGNWLMQCIQTNEPFEGELKRMALTLTSDNKVDISLHDLPYSNPVVALHDVHVRVDPTSLDGSAFTTTLRRNRFIVDGDQPIICVPSGYVRDFTLINLATGRTVERMSSHDWLSFRRWSLVIDDESGEELTLAQFDGIDA